MGGRRLPTPSLLDISEAIEAVSLTGRGIEVIEKTVPFGIRARREIGINRLRTDLIVHHCEMEDLVYGSQAISRTRNVPTSVLACDFVREATKKD